MGTETELVTKSRWVVPTRLLRCEFDFKYPFVQQAFNALNQKTYDHAHSQSPVENQVQLA
jgi:NAD dependent epimerase/dehydratase family enzyme